MERKFNYEHEEKFRAEKLVESASRVLATLSFVLAPQALVTSHSFACDPVVL